MKPCAGSRERTLSATVFAEPGDVVINPFAGNNTKDASAENLSRRWIGIELSESYARDSELTFREPLSEAANGKPQETLC
jgi:DNA modification methylase